MNRSSYRRRAYASKGYPDCADGSDELYCGCTDGSCTPASTTTVTTSTTTRTTATTSTRSSTTVTTSTVTTSTETSTTRSRTTTTLSTTTTTATETTRTISMITTFKPVAATTTTKTEYHPDNVDCVEEQDSCTEACERKDQRNYKLLVPQRRSGKACQGPTDCGMYYKDFGTGTLFSRRCTPPPTTTTTTTLTTVTAIPKVALGLAEEGSVNSTAVEADVGARTKPGMVVLYLVIVMLFVLVLYFVLQEMGYIPANFWTNIHAWFLAKWAALILCCCSSSSSPPKDDPDDKAPSSEVAETEFDLLSKGLMKNRRKDDAAAMAAAAAAPKSKFARDSDEDTSDEEGVEDFGPPKPDLQAAQLAAPLLDGESSEDEEVALVRHRKSGVLLGGVTQEGTTDQGSTVLYSDAGSGGRFIIPVGGEEAKPGQVLLGGVTTEGTRDDGQTVLYDSASATVSSIPTKKQHVIETSTVDYVIPMMTSAATGAGKKRVRQKSWVEDVNDVDTDLPSLPAKAADATDNSAEEFYDLATVAAPGSRVGDQSSGIADTIYSTAASGNTGAADTSIYLEPGQSVNFGATTPPDEELYSLAAGGSALHVQGGGAGQFLIPMAEDDGGAGAAQEEAIYSAALEAPPGEALYDAASPGGPPPPLPQKSSSAVNPEPTYPTPSPGEELYSLASGGSALHVQGGGAGQFLIPMAEDDGGAGAAQEETIYSAVLEAPPGEELYSLASGGAALHVQGGGAGQFIIPMAEDDGGAGAAQEEAIYSAVLEAPPGEALYDAASPGGPPPPLPQKSSSAVNPEPTYPTPSPGEELYSLASGGSALHVQGGGAGQFLIPMAEDDGGAGAAQEETIYSAVLEAPPGEELYSLASGGAALHVQGGGAGQFIIPMAEDDGGAGAAQEEAIYSAALEAPPGEALYDAASPGDPTTFRAQATTGANFMIPMDPTIDAAPPTLPQKSSAGDGAEK